MKYTKFGNTGMKVSVLSYGTWVTAHSPDAEATQIAIMKKAHEAGINFFDTAETYGNGVAETIVGKALKALECPRSDLVVGTKVFWGKSEKFPLVNDKGLSRKHIIEGVKASLQRLQLEYVDVIFCHRPDRETTMEEVCMTMSWLVDQGLTFYWGTSQWPACYISAAIEICRARGLHPPVVEQPEYSLLVREKFEKEYAPLFERYTMGTTIWSPLACGLLSGKYNDGKIPEDSRFATGEYKHLLEEYKKKNGGEEALFSKLRQFGDLAKERGMTQSQLALLWAISNYDVSTCILGASKPEQLEENLKTLEFVDKWDKELEDKVEAIFQNAPEPDTDFRTWNKVTPRRHYHIARAKVDKECGILKK